MLINFIRVCEFSLLKKLVLLTNLAGARPVLPKAPGVLKYTTSQNLTLDEL